ncbi:hypothetical protein Tmath_1985 [Thermoanaerobacter mathranii subsp. mathranii str. A3]|uniref:Uncharacterized protein n=1 Tax=Thermoanaerobacter mathranii subsp. mathranii (strain DSM 11426 / CCUG 53645 / CIP 108742 / A3) TaxID=583358 RepID=A0ABM5LSK7_THEM3|nr:hypothetical protein [Thermoanaerobacter mathranii]ADH61664.1 hypothetical protein Tmath_1979 [Thermoanaerobacter mathranii subsp. mathranii str. A3]ADH61670.1 hypothetical protein Tmath_1985 [Thermoanaerobacter mathranii subsp. mathranii str. A3]
MRRKLLVIFFIVTLLLHSWCFSVIGNVESIGPMGEKDIIDWHSLVADK